MKLSLSIIEYDVNVRSFQFLKWWVRDLFVVETSFVRTLLMVCRTRLEVYVQRDCLSSYIAGSSFCTTGSILFGSILFGTSEDHTSRTPHICSHRAVLVPYA